MYEYKAENNDNIPNDINKAARESTANKYLYKIKYGNHQNSTNEQSWHFEVVFDYGERDLTDANNIPYEPSVSWPVRQGPFSDFIAGFEIRTHRLCRAVLVFHRFDHQFNGAPIVVRATTFDYEENGILSTMVRTTSMGYRHHSDGTVNSKALPSLDLRYSKSDPRWLFNLHRSFSTKITQAMRTAKNQAQNLLELVDELLDIARLDAGAMKLNAQQINLTSFIGTIVDQFKSLADSRLVSLEKLLPDYACLVVVDQKQFRKVIINLINNGIKFTPENGKVIVELKKQNDVFMLSVRDTGCGMISAELDRVFDRFHQVDKTGNKSGVGLGLPLAREITELHNGTLSATSEAGVGSCFTVELPINTELEVGDIPVIESSRIIRNNSPSLTDNDIPSIDSSTTVLIVEDNVELR